MKTSIKEKMAKSKKKHVSTPIKIDLDNINIDKLKRLDEEQLRKKILIPLLKYIDAQNVIDMHGSGEEGIDIYFETFDIFGNRLRLGMQVKSVDLVYSARPSNRNLLTILHQIKMAFSKKIRVITSDRSGEVYIDGFYIVTCGKITEPAIRYIYENRNQYPNIHIIDGDRLMEIIKNKDLLKQRKIEFSIGAPKAIYEDNSLPED